MLSLYSIFSAPLADTVRLLEAGLTSIRHELAGLDQDRARLTSERQRLANAPARAEQAGLARLPAQLAHELARARHAALVAARDQSRSVAERRAQIVAERKVSLQRAHTGRRHRAIEAQRAA